MKTGFLGSLVKRWWKDRDATSTAEFALVFPVLLTMLMGVDELGTGIMINQKVIASSQMVADLIARNTNVTNDMLDDYIGAGKLALDPYSTQTLGFDITSIQYDQNNNPQEAWHYTVNMAHNDDGLNRSVGLGVNGDGALSVAVTYIYTPPISSFVIHQINMEEVAFSRGRRIAVVTCSAGCS